VAGKGLGSLADLVAGSKDEKEKFAVLRLQERMAKAAEISESFREGEGNLVVQAVFEGLEARISKLVAEDAHCQALVGILTRLGREINLGKKAAEKLFSLTGVEVSDE